MVCCCCFVVLDNRGLVGGGGSDAFAATKRLAKERQDLISTGAYNATHPIIQAIDTKLQQLEQPIRDGSA